MSTIEQLSANVGAVLDDYFPETDGADSLFIGQDEQRGKNELKVDLIAAVLEAMLP